MRHTILGLTSCLLVGLVAGLGARSADPAVAVRLRLIDADTKAPLGGLVRIVRAGENEPVPLPGLLDRLRGLTKAGATSGWFVVPAAGATTQLPPGKYRLEAVSGLETATARQSFEVAADTEVVVQLPFLFRPASEELVAGNTHLHLRNLTREQADDYLRQIPAADGLRVLFLSYLLRVKDDASYITNEYPIGDLPQFAATGVLFNNGQEHRHNFDAYGQGYGHVMLLNLQRLIQPVSIGPGLTGMGTDDRPLSLGIIEARRQGGTVIWCHNANGHEDVVNALAGRLDALNVFDGSRTGRFEDVYYPLLNIGLRLPISTGTDWFLYDFSRVYARVPGELTVPRWLEAVKAGRCVATNGPLLRVTVDGQSSGAVLNLDPPRPVRVQATAVGRHDFQRLELVHNGRVIAAQPSEHQGGAYRARIDQPVPLDGPGWFAARIASTARNEFDLPLYAHAAPIYVDAGGRRHFDLEAARTLLKQLEEGQVDIRAKGTFSSPEAADRLLALYRNAAADLTERMSRRGQ